MSQADRAFNVLLITTDQQRGDTLGVDGNPVIQTRALDGLARDPCGVYFTSAYAEAPVCVPQRTAWMLGQHPLSCGQARWRTQTWNTSETLSGAFAEQGWYCAIFGKRHFHPVRERYGFHEMKIYESGRNSVEQEDYLMYLRDETEWGGYSRAHSVGNNEIQPAASLLPEYVYPTSWITRESIGFLERHAKERKDQPFFLWTSYNKPHSPYDPPHPYDRLYRPQDMPAPFRPEGGLDAEIEPIRHEARHRSYDLQSVEQVRAARAYYYGMITQIDHQIGHILKVLEKLGLRERTLIAFTADHGDLMGDHHLYFKGTFHEGSSRVPYVWWLPPACRAAHNLTSAGRQALPIGVSSLGPSLLDLSGAEKPKSATAESLLPLLSGRANPAGQSVIGVYDHLQGDKFSAMLRWGNWKYIFWQLGNIPQLFDLSKDPGELNNLAEQPAYRGLAQEAHARLEQALAQYPSACSEVLDQAGKLIGVPYVVPKEYETLVQRKWGRRQN